METSITNDTSLAIALALLTGMFAQAVARHLRVPGIVLLLGAGVLLGPDVMGVVDPSALGHALTSITGFAVAVILFEGGLSLELGRLRRQARVIRMLLSVGVVVTALGGAVAARLGLGWDWRTSILFGCLVIVTGPTVITPLLRRIRVVRSVETILEGEGVLIDAVGAVVAVVVLEVVLKSGGGAVAHGLVDAPTRLIFGLASGLAGGALIALVLRAQRVVPEEHRNVLTLAMALTIYQAANAFVPESGIMAAVAAGVVVGNSRCRVASELRAFKEQLTVMLIGLLFVLLAADVRIGEVRALGGRGLAVVAALILVVRPLNILACTWRSGLEWRHKVFLAWVAPRGIVAAAVASLFAARLDAAGDSAGSDLRALVFLVIAATVVVQGATASTAARWLGLRRPRDNGFAILGAQPLGRLLASLLKEGGHDVVVMDANATLCSQAEAEGLRVIYGNAMDESVQMRAALDSRRAVIGALNNEAMNLRFAQTALKEAGAPHALVLGERNNSTVDPEDVSAIGAGLLFGFEIDPEIWSVRIRRGKARVRICRRRPEGECRLVPQHDLERGLLPLIIAPDGKPPRPVDERTRCAGEDRVWWLISEDHRAAAETWLEDNGWVEA